MNWRVKMKEQRKLRGQGSKLLYSRVKLLVEIEADEEFAEWCAKQDLEPLDELDAEVAEINASYLVLKTVLEEYPTESDWERKLSSLIAEVIEKQRRPRSETNRLSWKQIAEERQKEIERLCAELNRATARVDELERVIGLVAGRQHQMAATS